MKKLIKWTAIALLVAAVAEELRKPREQRMWVGRVANVVPYDLRVPTPARIMSRMWNPSEERLIVETPFGVGWSVNLARLAKAGVSGDASSF